MSEESGLLGAGPVRMHLGRCQREGRGEESQGSRRGRFTPAGRPEERESWLPFLGLPHLGRVSDL